MTNGWKRSDDGYEIGDRVEIKQYRTDVGTFDLPGKVVAALSNGSLTIELDQNANVVHGLGIISIDVHPDELELVTTADDRDAQTRIVRALGRMPYLPAATERRVTIRDFKMDDLAVVLEDLERYLAKVANEAYSTRLDLQHLRGDVAAMRRVLGIETKIERL